MKKENRYEAPCAQSMPVEVNSVICSSDPNTLPGFQDGTGDDSGWGTDPID